jgi:ubiquinone/menaquinone biosynthesis C-methylase UbiE
MKRGTLCLRKITSKAARQPMPDELREYNLGVYASNWAAQQHEETWYTREITNVISSGLADGASVLEVGVGTGVPLASSLLSRGFDVTGIDLSGDLAKMAAQIESEDGSSIKVVEGDSERLPFADDTFDLVYSISSSWYFQDLEAAVREMGRVTKPGGVVAFDILNGMHSSTSITYFTVKFARAARSMIAKVRNSSSPPVINWSLRMPWTVRRHIHNAGLSVRTNGYLVLLPVALPRLGERANIAGKIPLFAYGLKSVPLINQFGAKLLFMCKKEMDG